MPVLSTVQRRNLVVICGRLTGIMATSWYFLHWSQQKEHDLEAERLARQHPYGTVCHSMYPLGQSSVLMT